MPKKTLLNDKTPQYNILEIHPGHPLPDYYHQTWRIIHLLLVYIEAYKDAR